MASDTAVIYRRNFISWESEVWDYFREQGMEHRDIAKLFDAEQRLLHTYWMSDEGAERDPTEMAPFIWEELA